jgi:hypothetical protein
LRIKEFWVEFNENPSLDAICGILRLVKPRGSAKVSHIPSNTEAQAVWINQPTKFEPIALASTEAEAAPDGLAAGHISP